MRMISNRKLSEIQTMKIPPSTQHDRTVRAIAEQVQVPGQWRFVSPLRVGLNEATYRHVSPRMRARAWDEVVVPGFDVLTALRAALIATIEGR